MTLPLSTIHDLYHRQRLSLMRIAKIFDCRVREVREALGETPKIPPKQFAAKAFADMVRRSAEMQQSRKGKRVPVAQEQARQLARRRDVPVTLARVSLGAGE